MAESQNHDNLILGGAVLLIAWTVGSSVLESVGLKDSKDDKAREAEEEAQQTQGFWNPNFVDSYKVPTGYQLLLRKYDFTLARAKGIGSSFGTFNDIETQVYANFRQIPYKSVVSQVAQRYFELYQVDLLEDLRYGLSDSELGVVLDIVKRMPLGIRNINTGKISGLAPKYIKK